MVRQYVQSEEEYKGYLLKVVATCLDDKTLQYHRSCEIFKNGVRIGIDKTKKSAKELIDGGYI